MAESDSYILQLNISHYEAMLKLGMSGTQRRVIEKLCEEATRKLALLGHQEIAI